MSIRVDPQLYREFKVYGAVGLEKCINCGNCTAICPMSSSDDHFPRYMVRLVQLGLKDELLGSKELWLCYNCGQCSETCPQEAEPANFMKAARCYATTHYGPFNIGQVFCKKPLIGIFIIVLMIILSMGALYAESHTMPTDTLKFFSFVPYELIHTSGLILMVLFGLVSLATIFNMMSRISRSNNLSAKDFFKGSQRNWFQAFWEAVVVQSLAQKRYRDDCESTETSKAWYLRKWFIHAATMWGFLGLLIATGLNYFLDIIGVKETGTFVPLWYPTRLIGTLSGLLFVYGVSILMFERWRAAEKSYSYSLTTDWTFLILLWLCGVTGFIIEIALYLPGVPMWSYWIFLFHVAVSITLLLLLPFTKFAHAIYRIVALYIHALKPMPEQEVASASAD